VVLCQSQNEDPLGRVSLDSKKLAPETVESCVWSDISTAFARPVNRDDLEPDYVPTQILAEAFKAEGFGGILYRSHLATGLNLVLFNIQHAKPLRYFLYALQSANYTFAAGDPQFAIYTQKHGIPEHLLKIVSQSP
jgi:hypothetical protein